MKRGKGDKIGGFANHSHTIDHAIRPDSLLLTIKGQVTERFDSNIELERVEKTMKNAGDTLPIAIDVAHVDRMNSVGIRAWILFYNELQSKYVVRFEKLSEVFVALAGMTSAILGEEPVEIREFEIPFYCDSCEERFLVIGNGSEVQGDTWKGALSRPCTNCGATAHFDSIESEYFSFLRCMKRD